MDSRRSFCSPARLLTLFSVLLSALSCSNSVPGVVGVPTPTERPEQASAALAVDDLTAAQQHIADRQIVCLHNQT